MRIPDVILSSEFEFLRVPGAPILSSIIENQLSDVFQKIQDSDSRRNIIKRVRISPGAPIFYNSNNNFSKISLITSP